MTDQLPMPITAPFSRAQRASLFNLVRRAAQTEIMPAFRALEAHQISTKSGPADLVTDADKAAEAMITRGLQIAFPAAVIVGEENAKEDDRARLAEAELGFLIDPIDGTWNFANGTAAFGTLIAACRFGRPVFGLIFDPVTGDAIWADSETPSTKLRHSGRSQPTTTGAPQELGKLRGFVETHAMSPEVKRAAALQCLDLAQVSSLHCSAHHYRLLAEGAVDFNLASKLNPWDHAAGVLICQQAGGHAAMLDGTPYDTSITNGHLLSASSKETWDLLAEHFKDLIST